MRRRVGRIHNPTLEDEVQAGKAREAGKVRLYIIQKSRRKDGISRRPAVLSAMKRIRMMQAWKHWVAE